MNQDDLDAIAALKAAYANRFGGKVPHAEVVAGDLARVCALAAEVREAAEDWPEAWREILGAYTQGSGAVRPHQKLVLYASQLGELLKMVEAGEGDGRGDH